MKEILQLLFFFLYFRIIINSTNCQNLMTSHGNHGNHCLFSMLLLLGA